MTRRFRSATERERTFPIKTQPEARSTRVTTQCRSVGLTIVSKPPVADFLPKFDERRTLGDMTLAGEAAAFVGAVVAFPSLLRMT